ncbi:MAG TPA: DNA repair protein RadA [Candidatus Acidoferrum sp.]|nr:DNA repair protein RadA [Candidatus Acidoferrum sp.]
MAKPKTVYVCGNCGYESIKWYGKCPSCGEFSAMVEETRLPEPLPGKAGKRGGGVLQHAAPLSSDTYYGDEENRITTGLSELDRVFGGGMVKGSVTLLGGDPGIGKSTLLLQICETLGKTQKVLYVSGEESRRQIKMRAVRLGVTTENLLLLTDTELQAVDLAIENIKPDIVFIDSIQTMYNSELSSLPGNPSQIRDCAASLIATAKAREISIVFIGHMNKEGTIAGPKMLEHIVDTVLYFEGDKNLTYRIIRAVKNRFGSTNEIGIFEMGEEGLVEVPNPSAALLAGRPENVAGTCMVCVYEGTRPILAEVQGLINQTYLGTARRMANGIDYNRLTMLLAVLEKRTGLKLSTCDAYCNVIGGLKLTEPSSDLAAVLACASSYFDKPVAENLIAFGEVGLVGELRSVRNVAARVSEAMRLGYSKFIIPFANRPKREIEGATIYAVKNIGEAIEIAIGPSEKPEQDK